MASVIELSDGRRHYELTAAECLKLDSELKAFGDSLGTIEYFDGYRVAFDTVYNITEARLLVGGRCVQLTT